MTATGFIEAAFGGASVGASAGSGVGIDLGVGGSYPRSAIIGQTSSGNTTLGQPISIASSGRVEAFTIYYPPFGRCDPCTGYSYLSVLIEVAAFELDGTPVTLSLDPPVPFESRAGSSAPIPEPGTCVLVAFGMCVLYYTRRRPRSV